MILGRHGAQVACLRALVQDLEDHLADEDGPAAIADLVTIRGHVDALLELAYASRETRS